MPEILDVVDFFLAARHNDRKYFYEHGDPEVRELVMWDEGHIFPSQDIIGSHFHPSTSLKMAQISAIDVTPGDPRMFLQSSLK